jgi:hypothetical protein
VTAHRCSQLYVQHFGFSKLGCLDPTGPADAPRDGPRVSVTRAPLALAATLNDLGGSSCRVDDDTVFGVGRVSQLFTTATILRSVEVMIPDDSDRSSQSVPHREDSRSWTFRSGHTFRAGALHSCIESCLMFGNWRIRSGTYSELPSGTCSHTPRASRPTTWGSANRRTRVTLAPTFGSSFRSAVHDAPYITPGAQCVN